MVSDGTLSIGMPTPEKLSVILSSEPTSFKMSTCHVDVVMRRDNSFLRKNSVNSAGILLNSTAHHSNSLSIPRQTVNWKKINSAVQNIQRLCICYRYVTSLVFAQTADKAGKQSIDVVIIN